MQRVSKTISLLLTLGGVTAGAVTVRSLPQRELKKLEGRNCTLVHLWAAWCGPCVEELPDLLHGLASIRGAQPVVIDVSPPAMQKKQSLELLHRIAPPYPVFRAPEKNFESYVRQVDPKFDGGLPFSVLYHKGKIRKTWTGPTDLDELRREVAAVCR